MDKEAPVSVWPEWKITEKIGEGSFGKVYKAQRTEQGKSFYSAIKIITIPSNKSELNSVRSETTDDKSAREYFQNLVEECIQEVSTMEYFRGNSHVVSVEDFKVVEYLDEIGWDIYIRMEYLTSFIEYCSGKNLSEEEVIQLGIDLCKALEHCRQLHIIHRDIKPENIFVSRFGEFKLGDFGIARELERSMSSLSKKGTYSYMAPEMYRGETYDSRVDIYSLGIVLYKLMNHNRLPFLNLEKQLITYRDKENALARRVSGEVLPNPADAGEALSQIILKACAYRPEERFQEAKDFHRALEDLKNGRHYSEIEVPVNGQKSVEEQARDRTAKAWGIDMQQAQSAGAGQGVQQRQSAGTGQGVQEKRSVVAGQGVKAETPGDRRDSTLKQSSPAMPSIHIKKAVQVKQAVQPAKPASPQSRSGLQSSSRTSASQVRSSRKRRRKKKSPMSPWAIAVIVVAIAAVIITVVYIKLLLDDTVPDQSSQIVRILENEDYSEYGQAEENAYDFSEAMQEIKTHATTIATSLDVYARVGQEGERYRYYSGETLMKSLVYPALSLDDVYEEYYYWNQELFFAYIWIDNQTELYYYKDGKLIRWIDTEGVCHDNEIDNSEYVQRGEKYWKNSLEQLQ